MTLRELRDTRDGLKIKMRAMNESAEKESRGFSEEERNAWNAMVTELDSIDERIKRAELLTEQSDRRDRAEADRDIDRFEERRRESRQDDPSQPLTGGELRRAFAAWAAGSQNRDHVGAELASRAGWALRRGTIILSLNRGTDPDGIPLPPPRNEHEAREQARYRAEARVRQIESRAQSLTAAAGGYTVPNEGMRALEIAMLAWGGMRQVSTVITTDTGAALPIPTNNDTSNVGEIIAENTAVNSQDLTFGQLVLDAYKYSSKMVAASVELLQDSAIDFSGLLFEQLGTRLGRITNNHFTTGTGTAQPRGVVVAAANSSVTAANAGRITYTEILTLKHSVNPAYRGNGAFMCNDSTLLVLKKEVDSTGRPLWAPNIAEGQPQLLDGSPVIVNQSMANGATTKALLFGDFSKYIIRDTRQIELMRLDERYAELHQVAFLAFLRTDGDLLDAGTNPVKYLTAA